MVWDHFENPVFEIHMTTDRHQDAHYYFKYIDYYNIEQISFKAGPWLLLFSPDRYRFNQQFCRCTWTMRMLAVNMWQPCARGCVRRSGWSQNKKEPSWTAAWQVWEPWRLRWVQLWTLDYSSYECRPSSREWLLGLTHSSRSVTFSLRYASFYFSLIKPLLGLCCKHLDIKKSAYSTYILKMLIRREIFSKQFSHSFHPHYNKLSTTHLVFV